MYIGVLNSQSDACTFHEVVSIFAVRPVTVFTNMHILPTITMLTKFNRMLI